MLNPLYICGIMKKIALFLNISIALFLLNSFCAYGAEMGFSFKTVQHQAALHEGTSSDHLIFDVYFEDISNDDNANDTKGKKISAEKTNDTTTSFFANLFSYNHFTRYLPAHFFFPLKTALFIFIRVLRL